MSKLLIIGSGLSAAYARQAALDIGLPEEAITIMSLTLPEFKPNGAQFLHWIPESVNALGYRPISILSIGLGSEEEYLRKQWGRSDASSSFPKVPRIEYGWSVSLANYMIGRPENVLINTVPIDDEWMREHSKEYNLILHTFPTQISKRNSYGCLVRIPVFSKPLMFTDIWKETIGQAAFDAGYAGYIEHSFDGLITYDGTPTSKVIRRSLLDGHVCHEYDQSKSVHMASSSYMDLSPFVKPPKNPQLADNVYPIGRYAEWDRNLLSHHTYFRTCSLIREHIMTA
jgi:hypothetical protein